MDKELRTIGVNDTDEIRWGTHFCQFYETKRELLDLLVPYFKAGLENNEFCLWVTSDPLDENEARNALREAMPQFDGYVQEGQIEIVPEIVWYLQNGAFDLQRVIQDWTEKCDEALARGYDGMRATGNFTWLENVSWSDFAQYEEVLDKAIKQHKMLVLCTYPLNKVGGQEVIDVVRNHQLAFAERMGKWERLERAELKRTKAELRQVTDQLEALIDKRALQLKTTIEGLRHELAIRKRTEDTLREREEHLRLITDAMPAFISYVDREQRYRFNNAPHLAWYGRSRDEMYGKPIKDVMRKETYEAIRAYVERALMGERVSFEVVVPSRDGSTRTFHATYVPHMDRNTGEVKGFFALLSDITDRKQAEAVRLQLLERVMTAQEEERKRLAQELHDETGQALMSLLVGLRTLGDTPTLQEAKRQADHLRTVTSQAMKEVQRLAQGLRPSTLDDNGLEAALKRYASDFARAHRMAVTVDTIGLDGERLPPDVETALFRIAQEALTNTAKHASARHASILLNRHGSDIQMIVEDDGKGFEADADQQRASLSIHLGLSGMRERVHMLGGAMAIESTPGSGTVIHVRVPLERKTT